MNEVFKVLLYLVGVLMVASYIKDTLNKEDDTKDATLTNGILFIVLAESI